MTHRRHNRQGFAPLALVALITMVLTGCNYARMYDQDAVKTYGRKVAPIDTRSVPVKDGLAVLLQADPDRLANPLPYSKETVEQGRLAYGYFCAPCHGPALDGNGTVGQSFAPLPANLTHPAVLSQSDGAIYTKMRLGFKRHPRLFSTVPARDAWAVVVYMRSMRKD